MITDPMTDTKAIDTIRYSSPPLSTVCTPGRTHSPELQYEIIYTNNTPQKEGINNTCESSNSQGINHTVNLSVQSSSATISSGQSKDSHQTFSSLKVVTPKIANSVSLQHPQSLSATMCHFLCTGSIPPASMALVGGPEAGQSDIKSENSNCYFNASDKSMNNKSCDDIFSEADRECISITPQLLGHYQHRGTNGIATSNKIALISREQSEKAVFNNKKHNICTICDAESKAGSSEVDASTSILSFFSNMYEAVQDTFGSVVPDSSNIFGGLVEPSDVANAVHSKNDVYASPVAGVWYDNIYPEGGKVAIVSPPQPLPGGNLLRKMVLTTNAQKCYPTEGIMSPEIKFTEVYDENSPPKYGWLDRVTRDQLRSLEVQQQSNITDSSVQIYYQSIIAAQAYSSKSFLDGKNDIMPCNDTEDYQHSSPAAQNVDPNENVRDEVGTNIVPNKHGKCINFETETVSLLAGRPALAQLKQTLQARSSCVLNKQADKLVNKESKRQRLTDITERDENAENSTPEEYEWSPVGIVTQKVNTVLKAKVQLKYAGGMHGITEEEAPRILKTHLEL